MQHLDAVIEQGKRKNSDKEEEGQRKRMIIHSSSPESSSSMELKHDFFTVFYNEQQLRYRNHV